MTKNRTTFGKKLKTLLLNPSTPFFHIFYFIIWTLIYLFVTHRENVLLSGYKAFIAWALTGLTLFGFMEIFGFLLAYINGKLWLPINPLNILARFINSCLPEEKNKPLIFGREFDLSLYVLAIFCIYTPLITFTLALNFFLSLLLPLSTLLVSNAFRNDIPSLIGSVFTFLGDLAAIVTLYEFAKKLRKKRRFSSTENTNSEKN